MFSILHVSDYVWFVMVSLSRWHVYIQVIKHHILYIGFLNVCTLKHFRVYADRLWYYSFTVENTWRSLLPVCTCLQLVACKCASVAVPFMLHVSSQLHACHLISMHVI